MNIAVYSGSFNPLHIGHLAIMKYLTEEAGYDCVYLIVSPKNPLKDGISSATGRERFEAAQEA
ncbi:MAG: adenylyltransferase/cytidyltransferase family protein, partial [Bacteroidales bacterium]|nr:adenylyltransferase/cytidyltransferase family protein [Bacteroidales bacterium]